MPEFFVYVLENPKGRLYIGHTGNLQQRLRQHNCPEGKSHLGKYTHKNGPWRLVGFEVHPTRALAMERETEFKSWKAPARVRAALSAQWVSPAKRD